MSTEEVKKETSGTSFLNKKFEEIDKHMQNQIDSDLSILTEDSFVLGYLNTILALANDPHNEDLLNSESYIKWMECSKAGRKEVLVVDNEDHNKILYRVPPIYASAEVDTSFLKENIPVLSEVPLVWDRECHYMPARGEAYLNKIIKNINHSVKEQGDEIKERWLAIFNRYKNGYTPHKAVTTKATPTPTKEKKFVNTDDLW